MRRKESITQLEQHTSKLLDSLCLQMAYTRVDASCLELLSILSWRITDSIDEPEFTQLYKQWLSAKGVFDITKVKQIQSFDKLQLLQTDSEINLRKDGEISRTLRLLRKEYNKMYLSLNTNKGKVIEIIDSLFGILDIEQCFHLRKPQLHILFNVLLLSKVYILKPASMDNYWRVYNCFEREINAVDHKVSIRAFKNYFISNMTLEQMEMICKNLEATKLILGFYEDGIKVWKRYQKQLSGKNEMVCRRIFSDNQHLFLNEKPNMENVFTQLSISYGASFLALNNIDVKVVQQFSKVMDTIHKKHINEIFKSIDKQQSHTSSHHTNTSKTKTIKIQKSVSTKKPPIIKRESMKTPTKSQSFFTPRKQSSKMKIHVSPLSKTRHSIQPMSPSNPNSVLQSIGIFKNQRVQSFQTVMKRLKKR